MVFHFFCPQGHILEAEQEQAGQPAVCPFCGVEMLIPAPLEHPLPTKPFETGTIHSSPGHNPSLVSSEDFSQRAEGGTLTETPNLASITEDNAQASRDDQSLAVEVSISLPAESASSSSILHIPCPQGHILETPSEMLGMAVMCPMCHTTFEPQYEASQEYRRKREEMAAKAVERAARFWLQLAIGAAIVVLGGLIMLIIFAPR